MEKTYQFGVGIFWVGVFAALTAVADNPSINPCPPFPARPDPVNMSELNRGLADYAYANLRNPRPVGRGECADLPHEYLISVEALSFHTTGGPTGNEADYVWGDLKATVTIA